MLKTLSIPGALQFFSSVRTMRIRVSGSTSATKSLSSSVSVISDSYHHWKYWINREGVCVCVGGGGEGYSPGGALPYKPILDVPFFRVSFFSINSWLGYENWSEVPERVMIICSRTKGYCFQVQKAIASPIVFLLFCNLKIPKQGIKMQIFFLNGLWRLLENGHLPVKLHSSAPPPPPPGDIAE